MSHSEEEDEAQFEDHPILLSPVMMDYGWNVKCVFLWACDGFPVSVGD